MKIKYDSETDAIYVIMSDDKIIESEETAPDVIVDYNAENEVVAVEILECQKE